VRERPRRPIPSPYLSLPRPGTSRSARDLLDELINRPPRRISASRARAGAFAEIEPAIAIYCRAGKIHGSAVSGYAEARGAIPLSAASEKGAAFCGDSERYLETPRRVS